MHTDGLRASLVSTHSVLSSLNNFGRCYNYIGLSLSWQFNHVKRSEIVKESNERTKNNYWKCDCNRSSTRHFYRVTFLRKHVCNGASKHAIVKWQFHVRFLIPSHQLEGDSTRALRRVCHVKKVRLRNTSKYYYYFLT